MEKISIDNDIKQLAHKVLTSDGIEKSPEMIGAISRLLNTYYGFH
ncbi:hypothetical protein R0283_02530 [Leuconostoc falkenbergense]|nr:hypothetical protein [Leuconostoc falkenbergense]